MSEKRGFNTFGIENILTVLTSKILMDISLPLEINHEIISFIIFFTFRKKASDDNFIIIYKVPISKVQYIQILSIEQCKR